MTRAWSVGLAFSLLFVTAGATAQVAPGAPLSVRAPQARVDALVRLRPGVGLDALDRGGVEIARAEGQVLRYADWILVRGTPGTLAWLAEQPAVARLWRMPRQGVPPLDRSGARIGLAHARGAGSPATEWTGRGVSIADLDSHVDVFHPDFFYADAGYVDWVDVDEDGVFTPGVDAIDLDGDGEAEAGEVARVLRAALTDFYGNPTTSLTQRIFDPAVDWIYLDVDRDGQRDFGPAEGFDDATPAFGEPLFVPDDVDGDGVLDPEERLVRLGTSKFSAVYTRVEYPGLPSVDRVYRRGVDLLFSPDDLTGGVYGYADTLHASGVLGILAGGVPLPSRRFVGIAPDAELTNAFEVGGGDGARMMWSLMQDPDVVLHEYVSWTSVELDGGDAASALIDTSSDEGVVHVCPAGNIGGAGKHVRAELAEGASEELPFDIVDRVQTVAISLHAVGAGTLGAELVAPDGETTPLSTSTDAVSTTAADLYLSGATSTRDTQMLHVTIALPTMRAGWVVRVRATGGPLTVHGMLADDFGFSAGTAWEGATDEATIAWPATADRCVAVGSVPSHLASEGVWYGAGGAEAQGVVRAYSARGPRIDGDQRPHVVAPDNPWAPLGAGDVVPSMPGALVVGQGAYNLFGGTSGAGPHVAGVAALLIESGLTGEEAVGRITSRAVVDPVAGDVPNPDYGFGRLHASAALGGAMDGAPPAVTLRAVPAEVAPGTPARLVVEAPEAIEVRWDEGYDGAWDGEYEAIADRMVTFDTLGPRRFKVRVRDAEGRFAEAAAILRVTDTPALPDGGPSGADAGAVSDDGGFDRDGGVGDGGTSTMGDGGCGCSTPGRRRAPTGLALGLVALLGWLWVRGRGR